MEARKAIRPSSTVSCSDEHGRRDSSKDDRLGNLPEYLLHHILSFLDMKYVIQTSLLSRKWRYVWASLPFLVFNKPTFESVSENYQHGKFQEFATKVLLLRKSCTIQTFFLDSWYEPCNDFHVESWVRVAVQRKVQELHLLFYPENPILHLPHSLYNCKTLTSLTLAFGQDEQADQIEIPLPPTISLPVLRYLRFRSISKMSTIFLDKLFSGCPVLETLVIMSCQLDKPNRLIISSLKLKHLEVYSLDQDLTSPSSCRITLSTPNLISLRWRDSNCHELCVESLNSLETAEIDIEEEEEENQDSETNQMMENEDAKRMMKCLKGVSAVRSLILRPHILRAISKAPEVMNNSGTPFCNLKYLELITGMTKPHLQGIVYVLEHSHYVETLVIEILWVDVNSTAMVEYWGGELFLRHVKYIEVRGVEGSTDEVEFLEILLKRAIRLRKMSIVTSGEWSSIDEEFNIFRNELLTYPRASLYAKMKICKS